MCAIIDNNVRAEIFGNTDTQSEAGKFFLAWLNDRRGKLVIGGKLRQELVEYGHFNRWFQRASRVGVAVQFDDAAVNAIAAEIRAQGVCRSDDEHVLGLAQVSGARLLFTNDRALQQDFANRAIIGGTRGRIYTTVEHSAIRPTHRSLLNRADLCDV